MPATEAGQHFAPLFAGSDVGLMVTADFVTAAWRMLRLHVAGGAITALMDRSLSVVRHPGVAWVARDLIRECLAVGRAAGAKLDEGLVEEVVTSMVLAPAGAGTSMLTDGRGGF